MIKQTVAQLIKKFRTNNPYEIASQKNILVLFEQLGETLGYFNTYKRIQIIHINSRSSTEEQYFTAAHELGHVILHPRVNTPFLRRNTLCSIDRIEKEANEFAVELLMPDDLINEYQSSNLSIYEAAEAYGVPHELAHLKRTPGRHDKFYY
jgi:Zn-dependent peptidase ImmA (M78 family)